MATVSMIMVIICILATNSTAFVGLYFADPNNWLAAGFVKHNTIGVCCKFLLFTFTFPREHVTYFARMNSAVVQLITAEFVIFLITHKQKS